jgi:hypothetical protein
MNEYIRGEIFTNLVLVVAQHQADCVQSKTTSRQQLLQQGDSLCSLVAHLLEPGLDKFCDYHLAFHFGKSGSVDYRNTVGEDGIIEDVSCETLRVSMMGNAR